MASGDITNHLLKLADPKITQHCQRFFKTAIGEYGYGDKFLGIRVPVIRQSVKIFNDTSLTHVKRLLKSEYHEIRLFALLMLVAQFSSADDALQHKIYQLYLNHTKFINNWDLVDSSAYQIIGVYLENKDRSVLYDLSISPSLWERRISIIATYHFIKIHQFKDTLLISEQLLGDQEDLIHKAVGWMLREVGNRERAPEIRFLKKHYKLMPRTMLRYAIEKFSKTDRKNYLNGTI